MRFIAATHQDLDALVAAGTFRRDLLYRLRFGVISIPPLRDRRDDIVLLATRFIAASSRRTARLSEPSIAALLVHDWPGNVRELKGLIEATANLAEQHEILPRHLRLPHPTRADRLGLTGELASVATLAEVERAHVLAVYRAASNNKTLAARVLGISIPTLVRKLRATGVD